VPRRIGAAELVRSFYEAFNARDLEALASLMHEDAELVTARGPRYGRLAAREWANPVPGGELEQRVVLEGVREHGQTAVALIRRQWWWRNGGGLADEEELATVFKLRDGLIQRMVTGIDRAAALAEAGIE
jgi:ketosteroid isomerase-like protein